ncbi:hypothetical protein VTO73DRAFT_9745 [Trametes versicolor]
MLLFFLNPLTPATYLALESDPASEDDPKARKQIVYELRTSITSNLQEVADDLSATLHYAEKTYAKCIVIRYGYILCGWPVDIPFVSFSHIPGGVDVLSQLLKAWDDKKISFRPATPEDIANAKRDPATVHPNYRPLHADGIQTPPPASLTIVPSLVLRSDNMEEVGVHLTSTQPSAAAAVLGTDRTSRQRSDVKKPRHRDVTGPYARPKPLPKEGVKSEPYVLNASATEHHRPEPTLGSGEFGHDWPVSDPLLEFWSAASWGALTYPGALTSASYGAGEDNWLKLVMEAFGTVAAEVV